MRSFVFYNSLTRVKESFVPLRSDHVRIYACGPTVYNVAHIGNARMAVVFDLLARLLRTLYPRVTYVSNITDVEDKIMEAAKASGTSIETLTRKYENIYNDDMAALGVIRPDIQPRATEHIPEMIDLIRALIAQNHAYEVEGHVLFHVPSFSNYGGLSGRSRDDQIAGARVEIAPFKRDPADFVLWKPSTPEQVGWDSPWGRGRPGWHIECSAMSEKHLGLPIDIHGGGADLKFPHHENEIAQSCCAHGNHDLASFSKYWMHNGFVTVEGEKMSKSLGNFTTAQDLLNKGVAGEVIRYALLSAHYRQPLDWTEQGLMNAQKSLDKFYRILNDLGEIPDDNTGVSDDILDALCDDLNSPKAYAELNALAKKASESRSSADKTRFKKSAQLMGFLTANPVDWFQHGVQQSSVDVAWVQGLIAERVEAKKAKNFARADAIRQELSDAGIAIEDTADGTKWRVL